MSRADVYAKTTAGKWELIFKDITLSQGLDIWLAGFETGQNRISIKEETDSRIAEWNRKEKEEG